MVAGTAGAFYGSGAVAAWMGVDKGLAGFLLGLFSMAIAAKAIEVIEAMSPNDIITRLVGRKDK
jgi:hypothetical protein